MIRIAYKSKNHYGNFLRGFLAIVCFALSALTAMTAAPLQKNPVIWSASCTKISPTEGVLTVTAKPSAGWHLYGTDIPEGGPVAATLSVTAPDGIVFTDDFKPSVEPTHTLDANFDMELTWWDEPVTFSRNFTVSPQCESATLTVTIRFMACNDINCAPPKTVTLTVNL